jgi:hypothetical protein
LEGLYTIPIDLTEMAIISINASGITAVAFLGITIKLIIKTYEAFITTKNIQDVFDAHKILVPDGFSLLGGKTEQSHEMNTIHLKHPVESNLEIIDKHKGIKTSSSVIGELEDNTMLFRSGLIYFTKQSICLVWNYDNDQHQFIRKSFFQSMSLPDAIEFLKDQQITLDSVNINGKQYMIDKCVDLSMINEK